MEEVSLEYIFNQYLNSKDGRVSDYFTWEQFCEIFNKKKYQFIFKYNKNILYLTNLGNKYLYEIENNKIQSFSFNSAKELLKKAKCDGKSLKEIWDELA